MERVHENSFAKAYYDRKTKMLWLKYFGQVDIDLLIECHRAVMDYVGRHSSVAGFYDLSQMEGSFTPALRFLKNEFVPVLERNGAKYASFAMNNQDVFVKFAMNQMFKVISTTAELKAHKTIDDAKNWLEDKLETKLELPEVLFETI